MIKKFKLKIFICMFVLVAVFSVTSTCFAAFDVSTVETCDTPFTLDEVYNEGASLGFTKDNSEVFTVFSTSLNKYTIWFISTSTGFSYLKSEAPNYIYAVFSDSSGNEIDCHYYQFYYADGIYRHEYAINKTGDSANFFSRDGCFIGNISTAAVIDYTDNIIYAPNQLSVDVTHEFQIDTSVKVNFAVNNAPDGTVLKYSLSGVEMSTDLTAPLQLRNPVTYSPGVTNLVVKPNAKVYWALYYTDGSCLLSDVYQVPEYDVQLENADKDIECELKYSDDYTYAVLTATLKNGVFSDKLVYSEFFSLNISTGKLDYGYQNFPGSLNITKNGKYYLYALDNLGNVFESSVINVTDIFNFNDTDFSYSIENDSTLHGGYKLNITPIVKNWSNKVNILYNIELTSGHQLATVTVDTEYPDLSYVDSIVGNYGSDNSVGAPIYFNGRIMSGDVIRIFSPSNNLEDLKGNITFKIYKKSDNSLVFEKTYTLEVSAFTSGNITNGTSGGVSGSLPSNSTNSSDFTNNDYGKVTWSDISNMISTDSNFWQIIKVILNCLPAWITAPIFFFISAVVTICLTKMIMSIVGHLVG